MPDRPVRVHIPYIAADGRAACSCGWKADHLCAVPSENELRATWHADSANYREADV